MTEKAVCAARNGRCISPSNWEHCGMLRIGVIAAAICCVFLVVSCGGGGSDDVFMDPPRVVPPPVDPPPVVINTSQLASGNYANPDALDPLPSFRNATLPAASRFVYLREVPSGSPAVAITTYTAPGASPPADLVAMLRRAAELWTRRIEGVRAPGGSHQSHAHAEPGADGWINVDFLVGYEQPRCAGRACANHYGDYYLQSSDRADAGGNPVVAVQPEFFRLNVRDGILTIGGFRILAHEFGHVLDYGDEANTGMPHSDCNSIDIMCDRSVNVPAVPVERDFDGIRHHYDVGPDTNYKQFGIWADVPGDNSDLERFGVQVTRRLTVEHATGFWVTEASEFISDQVVIETMVRGIPSTGPAAGTGVATWRGDLIAVDTTLFQPILGAVDLTMDLETIDSLDASFTNLRRIDGTGEPHAIPNFGYSLERSGTTWVDTSGAVLASFHAIGADPGGAVAGTLADTAQELMGAFGALREDQ